RTVAADIGTGLAATHFGADSRLALSADFRGADFGLSVFAGIRLQGGLSRRVAAAGGDGRQPGAETDIAGGALLAQRQPAGAGFAACGRCAQASFLGARHGAAADVAMAKILNEQNDPTRRMSQTWMRASTHASNKKGNSP